MSALYCFCDFVALVYLTGGIVFHMVFWTAKGTVALAKTVRREWAEYAWRPPADSPALPREVTPCGQPVGNEVTP